MKSLKLLLSFAGIILFISSCKKENTTNNVVNPKTDSSSDSNAKYRLMSVERRKDDSSLIYSYGFQYDSSGRITRIFSPENNPQGIMATISYNGNEAVYAQPATNPYPGVYGADTIWFTLDSDNKALKRIEFNLVQNDSPGGIPTTYTFDTTVYEYDAAGLLAKETRAERDSVIWNNNGMITISNNVHHTITNHQISGGNVIEKDQVSVNPPGSPNQETSTTFEYSSAYPDNVALSNPAIMNEMNMFYDWPLNNGYKNMPDKMTSETINKDASGNIINTSSTTYLLSLSFDKNGYLATYFDSNYTGGKWYFLYSK
ncbi:MAG TPA: hypothetical protein VK772_07635 [Puia sp.]|jgi:YD repeat-containing protein|nr:hypothetical protein [Puia sp.]